VLFIFKNMKIENIVANWPILFFQSLTERKKENFTKILFKANIYWWRAYNIYDDILDGDGDSSRLPIANTYFIKFITSYYNLNLSKKFYKIFNKIITTVEQANKKELLEQKLKFKNGKILIPKKLPKFSILKTLSNKSMALSLGSIAIMYHLDLGTKKINLCIEFFKNFLSAKQLSDDSHDWLEDLIKGKITAANVHVLQEAKKHNIALDLKNKNSLFKIFLKINYINGKNVIKLCERANIYANKIGLQKNCKFLNNTVTIIENAAKKALNPET